jgi:hypothetical protein
MARAHAILKASRGNIALGPWVSHIAMISYREQNEKQSCHQEIVCNQGERTKKKKKKKQFI